MLEVEGLLGCKLTSLTRAQNALVVWALIWTAALFLPLGKGVALGLEVFLGSA